MFAAAPSLGDFGPIAFIENSTKRYCCGEKKKTCSRFTRSRDREISVWEVIVVHFFVKKIDDAGARNVRIPPLPEFTHSLVVSDRVCAIVAWLVVVGDRLCPWPTRGKGVENEEMETSERKGNERV